MRGKYKQSVMVFIAACVMLCCFLVLHSSQTNAASINPQINFQGKLTNPDGTNVTDGTYSVIFSIYSVSSGGTAVWTETQSSVTVSAGIFQVALGSVTALPGSVSFSSGSLYLGIKVGTDPEMTPRIQFTAAPYAFNADQIDGIDSSGIVQIGPGSVQNDATTNPSVFLNKTGATGNILQLQKSGSDQFVISNSGATTLYNTLNLQSNTFIPNQLVLNDGQSGAIPAIPGSFLPNLVVHDSQTSASRPLFFGYDNGTNNGWAAYLTSGACGSFNQMCVDLGNITTTYTALENTGTTLNLGGGDDGNFTDVNFKNTGRVLIGSTTTDTAQVLLNLDSFNTYADTATCSTTTNQGALYYNTITNAMRGCINGNWEDLLSTGGLGVMLYGVVPDSGTVPGDLLSTSTSGVSGPCKVSWASASSVAVQACSIYSGGRKIVQSAVTITLPAMAANTFSHLCYYNGTTAAGPLTNATTWFTTPSTTETANLPTFNANNPVACIATIKNNGTTANTIAQVYDTRPFTTSQKQFVNTTVAVAPSWLTIVTTTDTTKVTTIATAATRGLAGVVVAGNSAAWASGGGPNAILAVGGPVEVKATAGLTTAYNFLETSGTAGYAAGVATAPTYGTTPLVLGLSMSTFGSCATPSAASCQGSVYTNMRPTQ